MASMHRIQWIDAYIRQDRFPALSDIVERFEISRRQALRDIEYMRDSLGAPIDYCPRRKGYYYTERSFILPGQHLTETQSELLAGLAEHYEVLAKQDSRTASALSEVAQLLLRLSGRTNTTLKASSAFRGGIVPFRGVLARPYPPKAAQSVPASLQPFHRGRNERGEDIFEFYNSYEFIPAVLASGVLYAVVQPKWLREKFIRYLDHIRDVNTNEFHGVTK
jgi:predicted DNA-binding transcriptional regulator YafY